MRKANIAACTLICSTVTVLKEDGDGGDTDGRIPDSTFVLSFMVDLASPLMEGSSGME